jgi:hypothetical protein
MVESLLAGVICVLFAKALDLYLEFRKKSRVATITQEKNEQPKDTA